MPLPNTFLHPKYTCNKTRWWNSGILLNPFEFSADKHGAFTAFGFPYVLLLFISALSLIASARRQSLLFCKVHKEEEEMHLSHFIPSWGVFISVTDFFIHSLHSFMPVLPTSVKDKFHRALATVQGCWSSWTPPAFPIAQLWLKGCVCWPSVWTWWSHRAPAAESDAPHARNWCLERCHGSQQRAGLHIMDLSFE